MFGPVEVVLEDPANNEQRRAALLGTAHSSVSAPLTENSHRWLNSTSRFAGAMESFWKSSVESFLELKQHRPAAQEGPDSEVVLALIDDGVDMFGTPQTGRILEGKSFDFHDGKVRPPYSSANGHGTIMARMILKVCPMVKVYPIRLKTYESAQGKNMNIDAGYAAQVCPRSCLSLLEEKKRRKKRNTRKRLWPNSRICRRFERHSTRRPPLSRCLGPSRRPKAKETGETRKSVSLFPDDRECPCLDKGWWGVLLLDQLR